MSGRRIGVDSKFQPTRVTDQNMRYLAVTRERENYFAKLEFSVTRQSGFMERQGRRTMLSGTDVDHINTR